MANSTTDFVYLGEGGVPFCEGSVSAGVLCNAGLRSCVAVRRGSLARLINSNHHLLWRGGNLHYFTLTHCVCDGFPLSSAVAESAYLGERGTLLRRRKVSEVAVSEEAVVSKGRS